MPYWSYWISIIYIIRRSCEIIPYVFHRSTYMYMQRYWEKNVNMYKLKSWLWYYSHKRGNYLFIYLFTFSIMQYILIIIQTRDRYVYNYNIPFLIYIYNKYTLIYLMLFSNASYDGHQILVWNRINLFLYLYVRCVCHAEIQSCIRICEI